LTACTAISNNARLVVAAHRRLDPAGADGVCSALASATTTTIPATIASSGMAFRHRRHSSQHLEPASKLSF
ncbi:hypothetical protein KCU64_g16972, partial [Aureobasidium melanogenum]